MRICHREFFGSLSSCLCSSGTVSLLGFSCETLEIFSSKCGFHVDVELNQCQTHWGTVSLACWNKKRELAIFCRNKHMENTWSTPVLLSSGCNIVFITTLFLTHIECGILNVWLPWLIWIYEQYSFHYSFYALSWAFDYYYYFKIIIILNFQNCTYVLRLTKWLGSVTWESSPGI